MLIFIYYVLLFLLQMYMLIKIMRNKENNTFSGLIASIIISVGYVFIGFGYFLNFLSLEIGWWIFIYMFFAFIPICIYAVMLLITIVCKIIRSRNLKKQNIVLQRIDKKAMRNRIIKYFLVTLVIFILFIGIDTLIIKQRHYIQEKNELIKQNEIKEYVIDYLNENYGDGDFEIISIILCEPWFISPYYELEVKTSYFNERFKMQVHKNYLRIIEDEFNKYYNGNKQFIDKKQ
ncbi:MAG: hypothetical protein E7311_03745 [Clostridiales bacterium]|nr:hypothetical protein [Clostridiales bacterium]